MLLPISPPAFAEGESAGQEETADFSIISAGDEASVPEPSLSENISEEVLSEEPAMTTPGLHYEEDGIAFGDSTGRAASAVGVDTSFYNGKVNWKELKKSGIDFAIIRIGGRGWGNGALYTDDWFHNSLYSAQKAGLDTGVYFYSMAANRPEAKREALYVIEKLDGLELELPIYFDMEFSGDYPYGRTDKMGTASRVELALEFCETIEAAGYSAGIYANESFLKDELNMDALSAYPVWVASYTENNVMPGIENFAIWQFTDSARLPGISGYCDLNVCF